MIAMPSQFNQLVQSLSIASITPQQILAAGDPIFLDIKTASDINSINTLIQSWSRIHAPTYGQPIPSSGLDSAGVGIVTLLAPTGQEVRQVFAIQVANAGAAPIVGTISIGGSKVVDFVSEPGATAAIPLFFPLILDSNLTLRIGVSSGTASDLTTSCSSFLIVQ